MLNIVFIIKNIYLMKIVTLIYFLLFSLNVFAQNKYVPYMSVESSVSISKIKSWEINVVGKIWDGLGIVMTHEHYNIYDNLFYGLEYSPKTLRFEKISFNFGAKTGFNSKRVPLDKEVDVIWGSVLYVKEEIKINKRFGVGIYQRICFNRTIYFENRIGIVYNHK